MLACVNYVCYSTGVMSSSIVLFQIVKVIYVAHSAIVDFGYLVACCCFVACISL